MTINDLELETQTRLIHASESRLDYLTREGKRQELLTELSRLEDAARKAQWRLLDLK